LIGPGGVLIAGDHLIDKVEPNPLIEQPYEDEGFASPVILYIDSLKKLRGIDLKLVVSGHGEPIHHPNDLIENRIRQRYERSEQLLTEWEDGLSVFDWSMKLYGRKMRSGMPLVFSEVFARLSLLEERGDIERRRDDQKWIYTKKEEMS
jgi:glyoxylase-like metal-dependent hydrolase (beta-lactamase superfamily II)